MKYIWPTDIPITMNILKILIQVYVLADDWVTKAHVSAERSSLTFRVFLVYLLLLVHIPRDLVQSVLYVLELLADLVDRVRASNGVSVS